MILRRLVENLRRRDWSTVTLEVLIVVLGVFIGIEVANWNEARKERDLEQALVDRLIADFERIETRLEESILRYGEFLAAIVEVRNQVGSNRSPQTDEDRARFQRALGDIMGSRIPAGRSPTYVEMLSSGVFDVLQDDELKRLLIDYDQRQGIAMIGWQSLRDQALQFSEPIFGAMTLAPPPADEGNIFPVRFDFERMQTDPRFDSALGVQISVQANNQDLQNDQLDATRRVLRQLQTQKENRG